MFGTQEETTQDFHELAHTSPGPEKRLEKQHFLKSRVWNTGRENTGLLRAGAHVAGTQKKIGKHFFEKPCLEHRKRKHRTSAVGPPWGALRAFMRNLDGHRTLGLALWSSKGSLGNLGVHGVRGDLDPRGCPVTSCRATRAVVGSCDACGGSFFFAFP